MAELAPRMTSPIGSKGNKKLFVYGIATETLKTCGSELRLVARYLLRFTFYVLRFTQHATRNTQHIPRLHHDRAHPRHGRRRRCHLHHGPKTGEFFSRSHARFRSAPPTGPDAQWTNPGHFRGDSHPAAG